MGEFLYDWIHKDLKVKKKKSWKDIPWCGDSDKVDFQSHFSQRPVIIIHYSPTFIHGRLVGSPTFDTHSLEKEPPGEGRIVWFLGSLLKIYPKCQLHAECHELWNLPCLLIGRGERAKWRVSPYLWGSRAWLVMYQTHFFFFPEHTARRHFQLSLKLGEAMRLNSSQWAICRDNKDCFHPGPRKTTTYIGFPLLFPFFPASHRWIWSWFWKACIEDSRATTWAHTRSQKVCTANEEHKFWDLCEQKKKKKNRFPSCCYLHVFFSLVCDM